MLNEGKKFSPKQLKYKKLSDQIKRSKLSIKKYERKIKLSNTWIKKHQKIIKQNMRKMERIKNEILDEGLKSKDIKRKDMVYLPPCPSKRPKKAFPSPRSSSHTWASSMKVRHP